MYTERERRFGLTSTHPTTPSRISTLSLGSHLHSGRSARGSVATAPLACRRCAHPGGTSCERVPAPWVQILERRSILRPSHDSYCSHLLEHVLPSAWSEALPRSRRGHRTNRCTALSTASHGPSRYPIVRDLVVPPTEPSRFAAGELGKSGRNMEEIGAMFLCLICFRDFFFLMAELLPTFSRFREYWRIGSKLGNV